MDEGDVFLQMIVYVSTSLVIIFIGVKTYNTECFNVYDNMLSAGILLLSLVSNIYLANKYNLKVGKIYK